MKLVLKIVIFLFVAFNIYEIKAQTPQFDSDTLSLGVLLTKERAFNINVHTSGYGIGYRFGKSKSYYKNRMFEFDLIEMKAPNQVRTYNPRLQHTRSYIYGKLNNLYLLRAGYGHQHMLNRKPYWGGVEVRYFYYGGLTAAFARPVYLYIAYYQTIQNETRYYLKVEKYDPERHFTYVSTSENCDIAGSGPMFSGFDKIKIYPGAYLRTGFNFEFSKRNDILRALEIGVMLDYLPKAVPIMAFREPNHFYLNGYFSFHFGKRYN